jgi:hypothetical protein
VVFTDADGSYQPSDLDRVVKALDQAPVAIGTRARRRLRAGSPAGGQPGLQPGHPRRAWVAVRRHPERPQGVRRTAAQQIFSQARVDGFAFDVEVLWLARQLSLEVVEVHVQAVERQGSKVQMLTDALEMPGEVLAVRRARTSHADEPPPAEVATPAGALERWIGPADGGAGRLATTTASRPTGRAPGLRFPGEPGRGVRLQVMTASAPVDSSRDRP